MSWCYMSSLDCSFTGSCNPDAVLAGKFILMVLAASLMTPSQISFLSSCTASAFKRMFACGIPSLLKLWTIFTCVAVIHRSSLGPRLTASTGASLYIMPPTDTPTQRPPALYHNDAPLQRLDLPFRPRYIYRGSGRRFIMSKRGDQGSIMPLWTTSRSVAQQMRHRLRHQSAGPPGTEKTGG